MSRRRPLGALLAAAALALLLSACTAGTPNDPIAQATDPPAAAEPTPTPSATPTPTPEPNEVDPALFTDEYVDGVVFGVADGQVNCGIRDGWESPETMAWGCAVDHGQAWTWEETSFAEYCAQFTEFPCRNGLAVIGDAAPEPRRNTDADFGGYTASRLLANGEQITVGSVSCRPDGDGVRCADAASGHGFVLSASSIDAW